VRIDASGGGWSVVQVVGAVRRPGVYRIRPGARVDDAVRRAGGALATADLAGVNLAAKLEDGRQVIVPVVATAVPGEGSAGAGGGVPAGSAAGMADAGGAAAGVAPVPPLNLNTATAEQLDELDGVGPATAQKILAYRQAHGGFRSVAELGQVPGIGEKRLATLRELVRV
jgi:competence protein ComEA